MRYVKSKEEMLNHSENIQEDAYITATEFLLNPASIIFERKKKCRQELVKDFFEGKVEPDIVNDSFNGIYGSFNRQEQREIIDSISQYPFLSWSVRKITDDKTVACIINEKCQTKRQKKEYYMEPDWKYLQQCFDNIMYETNIAGEAAEFPKYVNKFEEDDCHEPKKQLHKRRINGVVKEIVALISIIIILVTALFSIKKVNSYNLSQKDNDGVETTVSAENATSYEDDQQTVTLESTHTNKRSIIKAGGIKSGDDLREMINEKIKSKRTR